MTAKPDIDPLVRENREIERRRQREQDRMKRILHAKTRIMGVDVEALGKQVADRMTREQEDIKRDFYYAEMTSQQSKAITSLENQRFYNEKKRNKEHQEYQMAQILHRQQMEIEKQKGAESWANQSTMFLRFTGEDTNKDTRLRAQKLQMQDWLTQQQLLANDKSRKVEQEKVEYDVLQKAINDQLKVEEEKRKEDDIRHKLEVQSYQLQQAEERRKREEFEKQREQALNKADIDNALNSNLMRESNVPQPGAFKGFDTERRQMILDEQRIQQEEKKYKKELERKEEANYAKQQEHYRRQLLLQDREKQANQKKALLALRDEHLNQKAEANLKTQYLNTVVYANSLQPTFFGQFGTSSR